VQNIFSSFANDDAELCTISLESAVADVNDRVEGGEIGSPFSIGMCILVYAIYSIYSICSIYSILVLKHLTLYTYTHINNAPYTIYHIPSIGDFGFFAEQQFAAQLEYLRSRMKGILKRSPRVSQ
jgi:hypothetical protein